MTCRVPTLVTLFVSLTVPAAAVAQGTPEPPSVADLAVRASEVQVEHCAEIYGADVGGAVAGYQEVAAIWGELNDAIGVDPQPVLLYWSGLMAQCLGQDERAVADLQAFLVAFEEGGVLANDSAHGTMRKDAHKRLKRLGVGKKETVRRDLTASTDVLLKRRRTGRALLITGGVTALLCFGFDLLIYNTNDMDEGKVNYEEARAAELTWVILGSGGVAMGTAGLIILVTQPRRGVAVGLTPGPVTTLSVRF